MYERQHQVFTSMEKPTIVIDQEVSVAFTVVWVVSYV